MSDDSEPTFSERVEDIRERRQSNNQTKTKEEPSETVNTEKIENSDKTLHEKLTEFQNGEREENPRGEVPKKKVFGIIIGGVLGSILSISLLLSGHTGWGLILLSLPIIVPLVLTENGREFMKLVHEEIQEGNQSQKKTTRSKPKRICSSCGWQNPQENSFCHDCGSELGKSG